MTFDEFIKEWHSGAPEIEVHTSGSTGAPKPIRLPKDFVRRSAERTNAFFGIDSRSWLHSCVAADFIGGKMMAVRSEVAGCAFSWERPSNTPLLTGGEGEITLLAVVPSQMISILDRLPSLPPVRHFLIGGSAIPPALRVRISEAGISAWESYGMTETASHIALRRVDKEEGWFETLGGITLSLDERGCLAIRFPEGEEVITNDLAVLEGERRFRILGRADMVIVTGGKKVNPVDLERRIGDLFHGEILVCGEPDPKWGERVVLKVEGEYGDEDRGWIMEMMRGRLEGWEYPKRIDWGVVLARTPNGKVRRK